MVRAQGRVPKSPSCTLSLAEHEREAKRGRARSTARSLAGGSALAGFLTISLCVGGTVFPFALLPASAQAAEAPNDEARVSSDAPAVNALHALTKGVKRFTLSNGLRVILYRRGYAPVFAAQLWVKVGGVNEVPGKTGAAHLLEHMAFKGTTTVGTRDYATEKPLLEELERLILNARVQPTPEGAARISEIQRQLEALWIDNEFSRIYQQRGAVGLNAATSKDSTFYTIELPSADFELWCLMESDRFLNPVFRQFYKELDVVHEERRSRIDDDPDGKLIESLLLTAYWSHPNRYPLIGWPTDLRWLTSEDTKELYRRYYRPDNMVLGIVGDIDPDSALPLLEKYFGRLPRGEGRIPTVHIKEEPQKGEREATVEFDAQPAFAIAFHKPVYPNPDDIHFSVIHALLADGRSSVMYRDLVLRRKLAVSVNTSELPGELYPSLFYVHAVPRDGVSNEQLRTAVQAILDDLKRNLVPEKDFEAAKKRLRAGFLSSLDSNEDLASSLAHAELIWGDWEELLRIYDLSNTTTREDVRRLAQQYLTIPNRTTVRRERTTKATVAK